MTSPWPKLSLVIPCGPKDDDHLKTFLASLDQQDYPKDRLEVLCIREGNSEEAKAIGIAQASGEVIGMFCTDNVLIGSEFLRTMVKATDGVTGAYTSHYHYEPTDTVLSRYFALLGANDPLCWWLGKADRQSWLRGYPKGQTNHEVDFAYHAYLPSLGDNGFFLHAALAKSVLTTPSEFGSCMDMCERLKQAGQATYRIVGTTVWHRSGLSWRRYFVKRWRYVRDLYWARLSTRRWVMVQSLRDWMGVCGFGICSLLVLPHLVISLRGYRRVRDMAWFLHPIVCVVLTGVYACAWADHLLRRLLSSRRGTVPTRTPD